MPPLIGSQRLVALKKAGPILQPGARLFAFGDSIIDQNDSLGFSNARFYHNSSGELAILNALLPKFRTDFWYDAAKTPTRWGYNQGIAGQNPSQIGARIAAAVTAMNPDGVILSSGANGLGSGADAQFGAIAAQVETVRSLRPSIPIFIGNVRPTAQANEGSRPKATIQALNARIDSLHNPSRRVWVVDLYSRYNQGDGWANPARFGDALLHPNEFGAQLGGRAFYDTIAPLFGAGDIYTGLNSQAIIGARGVGSGNSGSKGSGVTGFVPASMTATVSNATAAAVLSANADTGGQSVAFTITPTSGASGFVQYATSADIATSAFASGSLWMQAWMEFELDGWASWQLPSLFAYANGSGSMQGNGLYKTASTGLGFSSVAGERLIVATPAIPCPADTTVVAMQAKINFTPDGAVGTGVGKIHRWGLQAVSSPIPDWA